MKLLIEYQYFGTIYSWVALITASHVDFCEYEDWQKSSFRNRCLLPGANGIIHLSIPVIGGRDQKKKYAEIKIDYSSDWQIIHWRTIFSVYGKSPWFIYYQDELEKLFQNRPELLIDWNGICINWISKKLGARYEIVGESDTKKVELSLLNKIRPSNYDRLTNVVLPKYPQVFEDRIGFKTNMCILDLLFCEGKFAGEKLKKCQMPNV
ncbi:WbqC family protein [Pollutibacter soli]|uniref:WbqC family protein n=1 Tax=Pollutibacter soli TaxID=3034157 RepID=UPI00301376B7